MIKTGLIAAAVAIGALGAVVSTPAAAVVSLQIQVAPPAPRVEYVPAPRRGQVWTPGHWNWQGNRHVWQAGHWERVRPGYVYHAPRWVQTNGYWQQQRGGWQRAQYQQRGNDRDRDGIANRYDRDRDGDGVPNRYDNQPNNPYRR